MARIQS